MNIGMDRQLDIARGFRISKRGIVLVTTGMLAKLNMDAERIDNKSQIRMIA